MNPTRKQFLAQQILFHRLNRDQDLALVISQKAEQIAEEINDSKQGFLAAETITAEEIRTLLDPWVRHALRDSAG